MIQGCQIRAARALLNMNQEELATAAGLTPQAIRKIENGDVQPREGTISDITHVFNNRGIEFTDNDGVRFKPEGIDVLNGTLGLEKFFDQVFNHLKIYGGEVCVSGVDEEQFKKHHGIKHAETHIKRMELLTSERNDISFKVLLKEGDMNFMASHYCNYKWLPIDSFVPTPFYVFGDYLALITFHKNPAPKIMIIKSEVFADAYKKQFEISWMSAKNPK